MAITIPNQWSFSFGSVDAEIVANPTPGRMLIACVACCVIDGSAPTLNVGDVSRNGWVLLADPIQFASVPHVPGQLQIEVWGCPAARFDGWPDLFIYASASQITTVDTGTAVVNVLEVAGTTGGITVDSVTPATATNTTSITMTAPAPTGGANCLMIAAAASNIAYGSYTTTGTGWTQLGNVTNTNPEVGLMHAWREATTGGSVTFGLLGGAQRNWAGVIVALRTAGATPPQPNPAWPASEFLVGFGYDISTPLSRVAWTNQNRRLKSLTGDRGIQAELGAATQGMTTVVIDNRDGAYTPRPAGSATANAAGTTTTIKVPDAQATNINKGDFFRLATAAGTLKQLAVFQVTGLSSSGGTTTVTFARADGTAGGALAATASGDQYIGTPIDAYTPYRHQMTWNGQQYVISSGWLRDAPVVYDGPAFAEVQASAADVLETLTAANPSALRGEILRRNPRHYWPMDDAAGSGYAANASGISNASLTQTVSKYGAGANVTADFGASLQNVQLSTTFFYSIIGDQGTGWSSAGQTAAEITQKGYALVGAGISDFPSITNGVTIFGILATNGDQTTAINSASVDPTLMIIRNTDPAAGGQGAVIKLSIGPSGYPKVTVWDKVTHAATTTTSSFNALTGGIRTWALTFNQTAWAVYVSGSLVQAGSANLVSAFSAIDIGGEADQFFHGRCFPGVHAHVAVFDRAITATEINALNFTATSGRPATETISGRIRRKLNTVNWKGTRVVNFSTATVSAEDAPSGTVADLINELAGYQDGLAFPDAAGQLQYRDRVTAAQQSPRATLGENTAAGEIPYQPGMSPSFTPTWIYNDVEVANTGNSASLTVPQTTTFVAIDDTSARKYTQRTFARSTRFSQPYAAWHITWWWLAKYAYPQKRVETITVEASTDPTRWPLVLGIEVGDLVTVAKRPVGAPSYTIRCQVLRVQPRIVFSRDGQVSGSVTLTLAAATAPVTLLNDPTAGVVGTTILGV